MGKITKVIIMYEAEWCYWAYAGEEFDHSDTVGIDRRTSMNDAAKAIEEMFPGALVSHIDLWTGTEHKLSTAIS